jgi:ribosomal protein L7/L12
MGVVTQILNLFDELDPYESVELIQLLGERGYTLNLNKDLPESAFDKKRVSTKSRILFLKSFHDTYKISTIKMIKNDLAEEGPKFCEKVTSFSLKEAKDYVEAGLEMRKKKYLAQGESTNIETLKEWLNKQQPGEIVFDTEDYV